MERTPRMNGTGDGSRGTNSTRVQLNRPSRTTGTGSSFTGTSAAKKTGPKRKKSVGKIPVWGKVGMVAGLLFLSLFIGLMIGYSVIGHEPVFEVFSFSTWKHLFDLVFG